MSRPHEHCSDALCNHKANGEGGMGSSLRESHQKDRMGHFSYHGTPKPDERLSGIKSEGRGVGSHK